MKALAIAIFLAVSAYAAPAVVLLVRHAEKEALPADDPALTPAGAQRAAELARVVKCWTASGARVRELIASDTSRTRQTLAPLATATHLKISVLDPKDAAALARRILAIDGGIVVVAGHSNTLPALIEALGGPPGIVIADAEFDRLFAITSAGPGAQVVTLRYGALPRSTAP